MFGLRRKQRQSVLPYEELFSLISQSVDEVLWCARIDVDRVIYVNPAFEKIWGIPREELYADSGTWINAIIPEDRERVRESYGAWIRGNAPHFRSEFRIRRRTDGEIRWISDRSGIRKKYDGFTLVGGIAEDMTERRKLEEERNELLLRLQGALKVRDEFVSFASHELKTPLVPLKLSLETLLSVLERNENAKTLSTNQSSRASETSAPRLVCIALEQLKRMEILTNNLLDASQLQNGNFQIRPEYLNLSELIHRIVKEHRQWIENSECSIRTEIDPEIFGSFDPVRVEQILVNLMSNAVKYAPGKKIEVILKRIDGTASLKVRDHGPGVSDALKPMIFDRFIRGAESSGVSGFGLGLYICKKISNAHGATFHVRDVKGGGAEFELILPIRERGQQKQASQSA